MDAINSASQLIDNVLKINRVKVKVEKYRPTSLGGVLESVVKRFEGTKGVTITYKLANDGMVMATPLLYDAFYNLIHNAIKHSRKPVHIDVSVGKQKQDGTMYHEVVVEDDGVGIPDDKKREIFKRSEASRHQVGRGIGLSLVRTIIEDAGGRVWVEDRIMGDHTQGARFIVLLPAVEK